MKATITVVFILFIGLFAQAQNRVMQEKVVVETQPVVLVNKTKEKLSFNSKVILTYIYLDKNHKVKKELYFRRDINKIKLA